MLKNFLKFIIDTYYRFRLQWSDKEKRFYDTDILANVENLFCFHCWNTVASDSNEVTKKKVLWHWHLGAHVEKLFKIHHWQILSLPSTLKWQRKFFYDTNILVPMLKNFLVFIAESTVASVSDEKTKQYYTNILVPMLKTFCFHGWNTVASDSNEVTKKKVLWH